ncbi:MAG TPA: glucose-6-phosphate dehydrogenase assembly protein OpcA, partial [Blastocatellia bacterium]|nr:glucose-6-phosphate dehydrogenase assembly protein OpcA [Blastocatellia bacterium]
MVENLDIQKPRTVDVGAIDRELRRMWKEAASDKAHSVVRARILNLVVFTPEAQAAGAADVAAEIAVHHPSRGIIVGIDPAAPDVMTAEVSARCHLSFARRQQVCSEQVLIGAGGKAVDEVHGVVLPLLTSDLPTFLWWRGPGWPESRSFKTLAAGSDRVVLDSSVFVTGASDLARLENLVHEYTKAVADEHSIADLNWARLMPWRVALAGLYDVQHYRERLGHLNRVTLRYPVTAEKRKKADAVEPFLLAGWLAG